MFEVNGWMKFVEEDVFAQGCVGQTRCYGDNSMRFKAASLDGLIKALMEFTGTDDRENVMLDACDEEGRIDIQILENDDGCAASKAEIEKWRDGKCRLWLADYSFRVEQVERRTVALAA